MTMTLVPFSEQNLAGVCAVAKACFSDPWSDELFAKELGNEQVYYIVAKEENEVVGFAALLFNGELGEILDIAVLPEKRKKGIGAALMNDLLEKVAEKNFLEVHLEVREGNKAAIALYEKYGFRPIGLRKNYYRNPDEGALLMCLHRVKEKTT